MSADPPHDLSGFAEFADALRGRRSRSEQVVRLAIQRASDRHPEIAVGEWTK